MKKTYWIRIVSGVGIMMLCLAVPVASIDAQTITYVGVNLDQTDFSVTGLNLGTAGYWFPQFDVAVPVTNRPTDENDQNAVPSWTLFNFTTDPLDPTRTFSLDAGGVYSEGGDPLWNNFILPDGTSGLSGSIVDPRTIANSNNTVNKILLEPGVPTSFLLHIVVDNTNREHDPVNRLRARGQTSGGTQVEANTFPTATTLTFNGVADVHTFRYDNFQAGDFIKIQLNGAGPPATGAGFGGLLFDVVPEPSGLSVVALGWLSLFLTRLRGRSRN